MFFVYVDISAVQKRDIIEMDYGGRVERKKFVWFSILSRLLWGRLRDHRVKRKNKISLTKMIFLYSVEQRDKCGTIVYLKASQTEIKHARSYKKKQKKQKKHKTKK